jgi:glycosyltransferase involved in cell wall biosynthesis
MKKRILIFSLVYYPQFIGGAEVAIKDITDRISPSEIEFDMVTLRSKGDKKQERIGNINVYRVGFPILGMTFNKYLLLKTGFWKAVFLNYKNRYDATWSMMATYNSFAALFFKLFHPKIPFLLTLQEGDPIPYIKKRAKPLWLLFKRIFTKADHMQTISHYLADFARDMKATCPITVVPNAVDVNYFSRQVSDQEKNNVYKKILESGSFSKKENDILLITTSRLVTKNGVGDLIESLRFLPTNYKLIICGIGDLENKLKDKTYKYELSDRVHFQGRISHEEMPAWLQASDIFIRPSISEGFGNSFIEAMAARIPVIATPVGGIVDFLFDKETGLFCEVSNPQSIAERVLEYVNDVELKKRIINQAFEMVKEKYDWKSITEEMKDVFSKTLYKSQEKA